MKPKLLPIFVALTTSLLVFLLPVYLRYADLADDQLPSADLGFENPDDDIQLTCEHKQLNLLTSVPFLHLSSFEMNISVHIFRLSPLIDPPDSSLLVLRC